MYKFAYILEKGNRFEKNYSKKANELYKKAFLLMNSDCKNDKIYY